MPLVIGSPPASGAWRLVSQTTATVASGVTGNILTVSAPDQQKQLVVMYLLCVNSGSTQAGISLIIDGNTIWNTVTLDGSQTSVDSNRKIARNFKTNSEGGMLLTRNMLECAAGKSITVNKNTGNTSQAILYGYEIWEQI